MTKEVLLAIKGLQFDGSEENTEIETLVSAEYYKRNNSHYVMFEEAHEGFDETSKNLIKFKENSLDLTQKGLVKVKLDDEDEKTLKEFNVADVKILKCNEKKSEQDED